ncbi:MAG: divalent-cation tolerance protein CutA [Methyloligellaceae bacterium]
MQQDDQPILIYTTFASPDDAKAVGGALVEARLAACVNIFPGMTSIYEWEGAAEEAGECAMLIKSRRGLQAQVLEETTRLHPYDTPALLVIPIDGGGSDYLAWIAAQTRPLTETA